MAAISEFTLKWCFIEQGPLIWQICLSLTVPILTSVPCFLGGRRSWAEKWGSDTRKGNWRSGGRDICLFLFCFFSFLRGQVGGQFSGFSFSLALSLSRTCVCVCGGLLCCSSDWISVTGSVSVLLPCSRVRWVGARCCISTPCFSWLTQKTFSRRGWSQLDQQTHTHTLMYWTLFIGNDWNSEANSLDEMMDQNFISRYLC